MSRFKLQTSQFGIVSGIRQEVSDRIQSAAPGNLFAPEARKGKLFILTEPAIESSRGKEACELVTKAIMTAFYKDTSFSITTSLRKAVIAANAQLYEYNFKAAHYQRTAVGVTCAVIREKDLYIAQVQPSQAYIASKGTLRALPTYPSWDPKSPTTTLMRPNALGTSLFSEPELYRHALSPSDQVILCSSQLAQLLGQTEAERLFCLSDAASAIEDLYTLASRNSLNEAHVALIELVPIITHQDDPLSAEGISERGKAAINAVGEWLSDVTGNAALTLRRSPNDPVPPDAHDPLPPSDGIQATSALTAPEIPDELSAVNPNGMSWLKAKPRYRPQSFADLELWPPTAFMGENNPDPAAKAAITRPVIDLTDQQPLPIDFAAIPQRDPLPPPTTVERLTAPFRAIIAAIVTFFANVGRRRRPTIAPLPRFTQGQGLSYRRQPSRRFPINSLLLLLLLLGGGYIYLQLRSDQEADSEYRSLIGQVTNHLEAAQQSPDDATALQELDKLDNVLITLKDSGLLNEDSARAAYEGYKSDAEKLRASIERTSLLSKLELVATLPVTGTDSIAQFVVTQEPRGSTIYFISREGGDLFQQTEQFSTTATTVFEDGSTAGPSFVGQVRAVLWRVDNLMIIDDDPSQSSGVYLRDPSGEWIPNALPASEFWNDQPFPDIETFGGNLYIWQRGIEGNTQIQKYASGEFSNLPTDWITNRPTDIEIASAVDMAIDGDIYLMRPDGSIEVFSQGVHARSIPAPNIQPPLAASRLFVSLERPEDFGPNPGHIFIVDTVNQRLVEIDQQGTVVQQIRSSSDSGVPFDKLSAVAMVIDGSGRWLYIANGSTIYKTVLPKPPEPRKVAPAEAIPTNSAVPEPTPTP